MVKKNHEPAQTSDESSTVTTRQRLIEAAQSMMAEGGEAAVSLVGAAAIVGVSRSTAHHHFRTRADLIEAASAVKTLHEARSHSDSFARFSPEELAADIASQDMQDARVLAFDMLETRIGRHVYFEHLDSVLTQRQQEGLLRPGVDVEMAALHLVSWNVFGAALLGSFDVEATEKQQLMQRLGQEIVRTIATAVHDPHADPVLRDWLERSRATGPPRGQTKLDRAIVDIGAELSAGDGSDGGGFGAGSDEAAAGASSSIGRRTRRQLIDAALSLMARGGSKAVSLSKVASLVPVARSTVHSHFRTRDHLLEVARQDLMDRMPAPLRDAMTLDQVDPDSVVRAFAEADVSDYRIWAHDVLERDILSHPQFKRVTARLRAFKHDPRFYSNIDIPMAVLMGVCQGTVMPTLAASFCATVADMEDARWRFGREATRMWLTSMFEYTRHPATNRWIERNAAQAQA